MLQELNEKMRIVLVAAVKSKVILWDLDGTLFDGGHRVHLMPEDPTRDENWDAFNKACVDDPTVPHMASVFFAMRDQLMSGAAPFNDFYFLTARSKICEDETIEALHNAGYGLFPLIMRERGDHRTPAAFKSAMIDEMLMMSIGTPRSITRCFNVSNMSMCPCFHRVPVLTRARLLRS